MSFGSISKYFKSSWGHRDFFQKKKKHDTKWFKANVWLSHLTSGYLGRHAVSLRPHQTRRLPWNITEDSHSHPQHKNIRGKSCSGFLWECANLVKVLHHSSIRTTPKGSPDHGLRSTGSYSDGGMWRAAQTDLMIRGVTQSQLRTGELLLTLGTTQSFVRVT